MKPKVVALDAGGATLKASVVAAGGAQGAVVLANHVASTVANPSAVFLGQSLRDHERRRANLRYLRPVDRGYCVNWNVETELWTHLFSNDMLGVEPTEHSLVLTAPLLAPAVVNESADQVVFEEFGFQAYTRVNAAEMCVLSYSEFCEQKHSQSVKNTRRSPTRKRRKKAAASSRAKTDDSPRFLASSCYLVVDSGFSFTHVVPVVDGKVLLAGVKRVNVGGKLLTNYLKEIVSFRQWNVMDDTPVMNELKEALCYCSLDFDSDVKRYHQDRQQRKHWVLPDFVHSFEGRLRETPDGNVPANNGDDQEQALEMGVEMVTVPEVLFNPSDIGINQAGVAEAVVQAVLACPEELHGALFANVLLVGGNTKFPNFRTRLERDLRPLVDVDYEIGVHSPNDPILAAWKGCCSLASQETLAGRLVTKQEYEEYGSNICRRRF